MTGGRPVLLIMAKAPIPGQVKTRLTPPFTAHQAAALAAAALLDTLDACRTAARLQGADLALALSGDLAQALEEDSIRSALVGVRLLLQRGEGLAARLTAAHADAAGDSGATLQIGMDTPQVRPEVLAAGLARVTSADGPDAVLGLAEDGGWWALGLRRAGAARCLLPVVMSTSQTGSDTLAALRREQHRVELLPTLRDVDTAEDVHQVAEEAGGRFGVLARTWHTPPL
ncbi:MAG: DUF2064 domain-containing protein [Micropruina sp.]|nr:DUF2064 domain-containing protein [Micropruina sp.]